MAKFSGQYAEDQAAINAAVKAECGGKCERCGHPDDAATGYLFTVHHLDGNKSNNARWNLAGLCQRCHLHIQGKVFLPQFYMFEHSDWFKPHVEGYYRAMTARFAFCGPRLMESGEGSGQP